MKRRGFTLIELLVVIAIIAILTAIVMANFSGAKAKARDAKRISDLGNLQLALELYYDRCNGYPVDSPGVSLSHPLASPNQCPRTNTVTSQPYQMVDFISSIPTPPVPQPDNKIYYDYVYHWSAPYADDYFLHTTLETPKSPSDGGLMANPSWNATTLSCTGPTDYCVGTK